MKESFIFRLSDSNLKFIKSIIGSKIKLLNLNAANILGLSSSTDSHSFIVSDKISIILENKNNEYSFFYLRANDLGDTLLSYNSYYLTIEEDGMQNLAFEKFEKKGFFENEQFLINIGYEAISKIDIYGIDTTFTRESNAQVIADVNLMIAFHSVDGNIITFSGNGRNQNIFITFFSNHNISTFEEWIILQENQWSDKLYNLKLSIE